MSILILALAAFAQPADARPSDVRPVGTDRSVWARCVGARALERSYGTDSGDLVLSGAEADCRREEQAAVRATAIEAGRDPDRMSPADLAALSESLQAPSRPLMVSLIRSARLRRARDLAPGQGGAGAARAKAHDVR